MKDMTEEVINKLNTVRIDIKNNGTAENAVKIEAGNYQIFMPAWFKNEQGIGQIFVSENGQNKVKITAVKDGKLLIAFKGMDYRFEGKRFPVWIDYKSIKIDGKEILQIPVQTWHDKPFRYETPVKDGQEVLIEYETQYHLYTEEELKDTVRKLYSADSAVKANFDSILAFLQKKMKIIDKCEQMENFPHIIADCFLPIGGACRPAGQLRINGLRFCSLPFDWLESYSLQFIIKSIKNGVNDWFKHYGENSKYNTDKSRYVYDIDNFFGARHIFPLNKSVEEYLPEFKTLYCSKYEEMIDLLQHSKIICFVCNNRNDTPYEFYMFLKEIKKLYPNREYILLHIRHSENKRRICKYCYENNTYTIYEIEAYDIHEKGNDRTINPSFWIGNEALWKNICGKMFLSSMFDKLRKEQLQKRVLKQLKKARIDVKNNGKAENAVKIEAENCQISTPAWFTNEQGIGQMLVSENGQNEVKITAVKDGKLLISFKGMDCRFEEKRFPVWIDYKSIKINGKEILSEPVQTWHDKPFRYEMPVKDGQEVLIEYETQIHSYEFENLKEIILKLHPNLKLVQENIKEITEQIYQQIQ